MKKLICILGGYAPYYSPAGKIAANVLNVLKKDYDITVIAQRNYFGLPGEETTDGIKVIRINEWNRMFHHYFEDKIRESGNPLSKNFFKLMLMIKQTINYFSRIFRMQSYSYGYVRKIKRQLKKEERLTDIDILMPVSAPHESIIAATDYKIKHKNVKLVPYKNDWFAQNANLYENKIIRKLRYPIHIKTEQKTLKNADRLFALPPIADYYTANKDIFEQSFKVVKTEHPLLLKPEKTAQSNSGNGKINLIYAGALYRKLRNPELVLKFLSNVENFKENYVFNLFSFGDCHSVIEKYKGSFGESLNDCGKVSSSKAAEQTGKSDVIVTIGNNLVSDVPSKLFECLSYGKPIIHFYFKDEDPYLKYLEGYENSMCIKLESEEMLRYTGEFDIFCREHSGKTIDFEIIKKNFEECTPEYVANQFREAFES